MVNSKVILPYCFILPNKGNFVLKLKLIAFYLIIICLAAYCNTLNDIIDNTFRFNKWDEAKVQLEYYLKENSTDSYAFALYSTALENLKQYDLAITAMKNAINFEKSDEIKGSYYFNLGKYYYAKKQNEIAVEMLNKSLNLNATLAEPYYMKGLIDYNNKNYDNCFDNWKKYITLSSNTDKKRKIQLIIDRYENEKAEQERLLAEKKLRDEEEKKRLEEEQRRKEEILRQLMEELEGSQSDSKSLEDKRIKTDKTKPDLEDIK